MTDLFIPNGSITYINNFDYLWQMLKAWNCNNVEYLKDYFDNGGEPYISIPYRLIKYKYDGFYYTLPPQVHLNADKGRHIIPLPSLMQRKHFFNEDGSIDTTGLSAYNEMLNLCEDHGLDINAYDSQGLTVFMSSLSYVNVFQKLLLKNNEKKYSRLHYSHKMYEYMTSSILVKRGADSFYRTKDAYYTNILLGISTAATSNGSAFPSADIYPIMSNLNIYYIDLMYNICKDSPCFQTSPFPMYEQLPIFNNLILSGFLQMPYGNYTATDSEKYESVKKTLATLDCIFDKHIVSPTSLKKESYVKLNSCDSALYYMCFLIRKYADKIDMDNPDMISRMMCFIKGLTRLLQNYGADINEKGELGQTPAFGLLDTLCSNSKEIYSYLRKVEIVLAECGWDYTILDNKGKTFFDRYPNKAEAKKALREITKTLEYIRATELAYSNLPDEFER